MPPPSPAARRLAAGALAALALAAGAAASASAARDQAALRAEERRLDAREAAVAARLADGEARLAVGRARLEAARERYRAARTGLERRLVALYAEPEPDPVVELLLGGDLGDVTARLDLLEALGRRDRALVAGHRAALAELRRAEAAARRDKEALAAERRRAADAHAGAASRLAAALRRARRERAAAAVRAAAMPPATEPAPAPGGGGIGLSAALLAARALPGSAPVDAATGLPIDLTPAPAGPAPTRAYPRIGVVGPAAGLPPPGTFPTAQAVASWYGPGFERARTASGEPFDPRAFSAASRTLPFGTLLRVGYGGRSVIVRVNDRGPFVPGRDLDLSQAAAAELGMPGVATVSVEILPRLAPAPGDRAGRTPSRAGPAPRARGGRRR